MIFTSSFPQKSVRHNRLLHQGCSRLEGSRLKCSRLEGSTASQTLCPRAAPPIKAAAAAVIASIVGTNKNGIKIILSTNPAAPANIILLFLRPCRFLHVFDFMDNDKRTSHQHNNTSFPRGQNFILLRKVQRQQQRQANQQGILP